MRVTTDRGRYEAAKRRDQRRVRGCRRSCPRWRLGLMRRAAGRALDAAAAPGAVRADDFPVFYIDTPRGAFYGFPADAQLGFKIGKYHHRRQTTDPDALDRVVLGRGRSGAPRGALALFSGRERSHAVRMQPACSRTRRTSTS